jgi:hypothetical protein
LPIVERSKLPSNHLVFNGSKIFELLEDGTEFIHKEESGNIMNRWDSSISEAFETIV